MAEQLEQPGASVGSDTKSYEQAPSPPVYKDGHGGEAATVSRAVLYKVDRHLFPILWILYLLSFLDRSNISGAKLYNLTKDVHITADQYNTALALFFVGYVLFEVPSMLVLKKTNPKVWLPVLAGTWAIITILQAFVHNKAGLFAIRFFLGVSECGLFPAATYLFSLYYPRDVRHFRVSLFFAGAAAAGAFGGILAYALGQIQAGSIKRWGWIFVVEGLVTFLFAVAAYFIIPKSRETAKFLTSEEKSELQELLDRTNAIDSELFNWDGVKQAFTDPGAYAYAFLFHFHSFSLYSISLFTPTIINDMGFAVWKSQLLTTPPYVLAFLWTILIATLSYKYKRRAPFIILNDIIIIIGYILLISNTRTASSYTGLFFVISGIYASTALVLSWPSENLSSQTKRATGLGMQISIGNLGAITSTLLYRAEFSGHHYRKPHIITLGYIVGGAVLTGVTWYFLDRANKSRDAREAGEKAGAVESEAEHQERLRLGDRHVSFRYNL